MARPINLCIGLNESNFLSKLVVICHGVKEHQVKRQTSSILAEESANMKRKTLRRQHVSQLQLLIVPHIVDAGFVNQCAQLLYLRPFSNSEHQVLRKRIHFLLTTFTVVSAKPWCTDTMSSYIIANTTIVANRTVVQTRWKSPCVTITL